MTASNGATQFDISLSLWHENAMLRPAFCRHSHLPHAAGRRVWLLYGLGLLGLVACVSATDASTQNNGQSTGSGADGTSNPTGVGCSTDSTTGVRLCTGTSLCPSVVVDTIKFPNCGYSTFGPTFDVECLCFGNYVCPVGTASSCSAVSSLFTGKTVADVCNEVSLGYCTQGKPTTTQGTGGSTSTCDQSCYYGCVDSPACIVACGC